jgi:hypothetical protein
MTVGMCVGSAVGALIDASNRKKAEEEAKTTKKKKKKTDL